MLAGGVVGPAFLVQRGLRQGEELPPVRGDGQAFESLVVGAAGLGVRGDEGAVRFVDRRGVGAEGYGAVASRQVCGRRLDRGEYAAGGGDVVDVRPVFVADPEGAVGGKDKAFAVDGYTLTPRTRTAEAIAGIIRGGEEGETVESKPSLRVCFETCCRLAAWVSEEDAVKVFETEIGRRGSRGRAFRRRREGDGKFVDPVLVVEGTLGVPT